MKEINDLTSSFPYLYRENGMESEIIEVRFKKKINIGNLYNAVTQTLQYYPYFKKGVKEKKGVFKLVDNERPFMIKKTKRFHKLGGKETNYHLLDFTYYENSIFIAFHHALCDGRGIKPFIERLICLYCFITYNEPFIETGKRIIGTMMSKDEVIDPLSKGLYDTDIVPNPEIIKDGFELPEQKEIDTNMHLRYEVILDRDEFVKYSKDHKASPAILVAIIVQKAINNLNENIDKPIVCSMASDNREALGLTETYKNCVSSIYLPYKEEMKDMKISEISEIYRSMIKAQKDVNYVRSNVNNMVKLAQKIESIIDFEERKKMLSFFSTIKINSFVLSYPGAMNIGKCDKYLSDIHLYSTSSNDFTLNIMSIGDTVSLDIEQCFINSKYIKEICNILGSMGLTFELNGPILFDTPKDAIQETLAIESNREELKNKVLEFLGLKRKEKK